MLLRQAPDHSSFVAPPPRLLTTSSKEKPSLQLAPLLPPLLLLPSSSSEYSPFVQILDHHRHRSREKNPSQFEALLTFAYKCRPASPSLPPNSRPKRPVVKRSPTRRPPPRFHTTEGIRCPQLFLSPYHTAVAATAAARPSTAKTRIKKYKKTATKTKVEEVAEAVVAAVDQ